MTPWPEATGATEAATAWTNISFSFDAFAAADACGGGADQRGSSEEPAFGADTNGRTAEAAGGLSARPEPVAAATELEESADEPMDRAQPVDAASRVEVGEARRPLVVRIESARGLRNTDPGNFGKSDPYCVMEVPGRAQPRVKTKVCNNTTDPVWNHQIEVAEFGADDSLTFMVYDQEQRPKKDCPLGSAVLRGVDVLRPGGFDGELDLSDARAASSGPRAVLRVRVSAIGEASDAQGGTLGDCSDVGRTEADEGNLADAGASCSSLAVGAAPPREQIASRLAPVSAPSTEDRLDSRSFSPGLGSLPQDVHGLRAGVASDIQDALGCALASAHHDLSGGAAQRHLDIQEVSSESEADSPSLIQTGFGGLASEVSVPVSLAAPAEGARHAVVSRQSGENDDEDPLTLIGPVDSDEYSSPQEDEDEDEKSHPLSANGRGLAFQCGIELSSDGSGASSRRGRGASGRDGGGGGFTTDEDAAPVDNAIGVSSRLDLDDVSPKLLAPGGGGRGSGRNAGTSQASSAWATAGGGQKDTPPLLRAERRPTASSDSENEEDNDCDSL